MARSWSGCRGDGISCERREDNLRGAVESVIEVLEADEARRGRRDMGEEGGFIISMGGVGRSRNLCMLLCDYRAGASLLVNGAVGELWARERAPLRNSPLCVCVGAVGAARE